MKKITLALLAVMALTFASCGGSSSSSNAGSTETTESTSANDVVVPNAGSTETTESTSTNDVVVPNDAIAANDLIAAYKDLVNKAIPLVTKMKSGDVAAAQEYSTLIQELAAFIQDNREIIYDLPAADVPKFCEVSEQLTANVLAAYEDLVNKAIPLVTKMKSGDAAAAQEYSTLAQVLAALRQDNTEVIYDYDLSEADVAKFAELSQQLAAAAQ